MKKKLLGILLVIALLMTNVSAFASELGNDFGFFAITNPGLANITVENLQAGDVVTAYKLVDITFIDGNSQQLPENAYAWITSDDDFTAFVGTATVASVLDDESEQAGFIADLVVAMGAGTVSLTAADSDTVPENTQSPASLVLNGANNNGLAMGFYLITVTSADRVYLPMSAVIQPTYRNGEWYSDSVEVAAKFSTVSIDKQINKGVTDGHNPDNYDTVAIGDTVTFDIYVGIPQYPANATDMTYIITDTMSAGLTYVDNSLTITRADLSPASQTTTDPKTYADRAGSTFTAGTHYTLSGPTDQKLTVEFKYADTSLLTDSTGFVHIQYKATINENAQIGVNTNTNKAELEYDTTPYVADGHKTINDEVKYYPYGLEVVKIGEAGEDGIKPKLPGAEFALYKGASIDSANVIKFATETTTETVDNNEVTTIVSYYPDANGSAVLTTNAGGLINIKGLDEGTYTLEETKAPGGYNKPIEPWTIIITKNSTNPALAASSNDNASVHLTLDGYLTATIENNQGPTLPSTGGMGTTIFTIVGIALMAGVVVLLLVMNKKKATKAN